MIKPPKISAVLQKKHQGEVAISLNGKVIAFGKNAVKALTKAKSKMPDIEKKEFAVSKIHHKYLAV